MNFKKSFMCFTFSLLIYIVIFYNTTRVSNNDIFGFVILCYYLIIPIVSLICAFILQLFSAPLKWVYPFLFAMFSIIITIATKLFDDVGFLCVLSPFIGATLGWLINVLKKE